MRWRPDPRAGELRRTTHACLAIVLPLLALYGFVVILEKGVGFAPAYAQEGTTTTKKPGTTLHPGTTGAPSTTSRPPTTEQPTTTTRITTGTIPNSTEPEEEPTTTVSIIDFPDPTNSGEGGSGGGGSVDAPSTNCHKASPGVNIYYRCGGARWVCRYKQTTPGTYCIDP